MKKKSEKTIRLEKEMALAAQIRADYVKMGCGGMNGIIASAAWNGAPLEVAKSAVLGKIFGNG